MVGSNTTTYAGDFENCSSSVMYPALAGRSASSVIPSAAMPFARIQLLAEQ